MNILFPRRTFLRTALAGTATAGGLGFLARLRPVTAVILMLVKNDYMTGDTVTIDGGLTSRIA